jgi:hypothetical protein
MPKTGVSVCGRYTSELGSPGRKEKQSMRRHKVTALATAAVLPLCTAPLIVASPAMAAKKKCDTAEKKTTTTKKSAKKVGTPRTVRAERF